MRAKLLAGAAAAALVAASAVAITAGPAHAQGLGLEACTGTSTWNYSPPLITEPQLGNISNPWSYPTCLGLDLTISSVTKGGWGISGQTISCRSPFVDIANTPARPGIRWSNGNTSIVAITSTNLSEDTDNLTLTYTGTVTSGTEFVGDSVVQTNVFPLSVFQGCSDSNPVSTLQAVSELDIAGL